MKIVLIIQRDCKRGCCWDASGACLQAIKQLNKEKYLKKTVLLLQFSVIMDLDI